MKARPAAHPTPEKLEAFGRGTLPPGERESIEAHVAGCSSCCQALNAVPNDTLMSLARKAAPKVPLGETVAIAGDTTPPAIAPDLVYPDAPALPPELVDHPRYKVLGLLGFGGMGAVYKAEHRIMERTVALKVINREFMKGQATAAERFRLEVKAAAKLNHPNVVAAHDADQAGDLHFLVMEYVDGVSLSKLVEKKGALSVAHACYFIRQAALGLQHAHEHGMVHRDIKPQNLMLTKKGQVKVLDFGLARLASERRVTQLDPAGLPMPDDADSGTAPLTAPGLVLGTPDYIAPEQARNPSTTDVRADIYSLGCTLHYLLTGKPPFPAGSAFDKLLAHLQQEPPPLDQLRDDVPGDLAAVVQTMMAKEPSRRYQTPADVARALAPFARSESASITTESVPIPVPAPVPAVAPSRKLKRTPRRKSRKAASGAFVKWVVLAGVALLLVGGGLLGAWAAWKSWPAGGTPAGSQPVIAKQPWRILVVVPSQGYYHPDYEPVERVLTQSGAKLTIGSTTTGTSPPLGGPGKPLPIEVDIDKATPADFDAVVLIGGDMTEFTRHPVTLVFMKKVQASRKPVGAICRGIMLLTASGMLAGQRAAKAEELKPWIAPRVTWVDQPVVVDGKIVTAKNPAAAEEFAHTLLKVMSQDH